MKRLALLLPFEARARKERLLLCTHPKKVCSKSFPFFQESISSSDELRNKSYRLPWVTLQCGPVQRRMRNMRDRAWGSRWHKVQTALTGREPLVVEGGSTCQPDDALIAGPLRPRAARLSGLHLRSSQLRLHRLDPRLRTSACVSSCLTPACLTLPHLRQQLPHGRVSSCLTGAHGSPVMAGSVAHMLWQGAHCNAMRGDVLARR